LIQQDPTTVIKELLNVFLGHTAQHSFFIAKEVTP